MEKFISEKDGFTVEEASGILNIHPGTLRKWVSENKLQTTSLPRKKIIIPTGEILRLQKESGEVFVTSSDGFVDYRDLPSSKQTQLVSERIDYLEIISSEKELECEIKRLEESLINATKALDQIKKEKENIAYRFTWPNLFYGHTIKNIPSIFNDERFQKLLDYKLIQYPYIKNDIEHKD